MTSSDYQTEFKDGFAKMTIEETFSEDTAKYTCRATTDAGSAETSATLKVRGKREGILLLTGPTSKKSKKSKYLLMELMVSEILVGRLLK